MRDPYAVLGVPRTATAAELKKAYRKLAKANHPDQNADNAAALERFKEANAAYELLSDADQRGAFDRGEIGPDGQPKGFAGNGFPGGGFPGGGFRPGAGPRPGAAGQEFGGASAEDLFEQLLRGQGGASPFGRRGPPPPTKGPDVGYRLNIGFEDAATLAPQRITLKHGKTIDLKLPAGFEAGRQVRLAGQGEPGPGGPGDALVTLQVSAHRFFTRDGDDVRLELPLRLDEAVLGAKVRVPTVDGAVTLTVPPGTTSGRVLRLRGKGFTRADGTRGDQLATLLVDLPGDDAELRAFAEGWAGKRAHAPRATLGEE